MNKRERKRPEDKCYCFQGAFLRIQKIFDTLLFCDCFFQIFICSRQHQLDTV